jgi:predicted nucleic acid-binding protein
LRAVRSYRRKSPAPEITVAAELEGASRGPSFDTSVLAAGISGFQESYVPCRNPSAGVLHEWAEKDNFAWLYTEDIRDEYKEVLKRLRVRPHLIGRVVNLIRDRAEEVRLHISIEISSDPKDDSFCLCANESKAHSIVTLNSKDFPQDRLKA